MTYKIIQLAIDALLMHAKVKGNSGQFNRDMDEAINALKTVKKYFWRKPLSDKDLRRWPPNRWRKPLSDNDLRQLPQKQN